jgi:predicted nucleic acid-binding protein
MIFLDSWVWLEFVFDGEYAEAAESAIERADSPTKGGLVTPTVITEVSYRIRRVEDAETAEAAVRAIQSYDSIESIPVVDDIGEYAAQLRDQYYDRGEQALSYADAIHLAIAALHDGCDALYTGDPDFADVAEVETVLLSEAADESP